MSRATLETIGEAGDVMNRCEALLHLLRQLEGRVSGTEQLTPEKEAAVLDANWRWSESSKDYVDPGLRRRQPMVQGRCRSARPPR